MIGLNADKQLDEKFKEVISKMQEVIEKKDKEIEKRGKIIAVLENELSYLKNQILSKNRKIFATSSEQVSLMQISIFDEAEKFSNPNTPEPTTEEIITYKRKKPSKNIGKKDNLANLEKVTIEHKIEDNNKVCDKCSNDLVVIGTKSKEVLKYIPAKLYVEEHITYSYACKSCEQEDDKAKIVTAAAPKTLLHKSMASNELLSHVINLKYQHAMPLYRQESYFKMLGANLSRQTLSNWVMSCANELESVYSLMKEELLKRDYIQADETTLKVINDKGEDSNSKKYMWLYKSPSKDEPIILYDYQKTRSSSCPRDFLKGFSGYLQTDGYNGYNKVENVKRLYCLAHIRRKYYDIIVNLDQQTLKDSRAVIGFNYCSKLYNIEKDLRESYSKDEDYYKKRYKIRLEKSKPLIEDFMSYVQREIEDALPRSPLGKALEYTRKLLPNFKIFLEDGRLEIDNNGAERSIKSFVIGRKNWLFSNSSKGAKASALIYSIIETAKANGLVIEKYLVYLMNKLSNIDMPSNNKEALLELMPWSKELSQELQVTKKK